MLGTLSVSFTYYSATGSDTRSRIFEGGGEEDCLRLLVGKMPTSKTGQVGQSTTSMTLPLSPYYATVLADLARERGFDGYLLNFECPLTGGVEQTRALAAWITLLHSEILEKVGPHGETLWYAHMPSRWLDGNPMQPQVRQRGHQWQTGMAGPFE